MFSSAISRKSRLGIIEIEKEAFETSMGTIHLQDIIFLGAKIYDAKKRCLLN